MELVLQLVLLIVIASIVTIAPILIPCDRMTRPCPDRSGSTPTRLPYKVAHYEPDSGIHRGARHLGRVPARSSR